MTATPVPSPVVQATGLHKRFGSRVAVADVSLAVQPGEIVGLVGPNGAGKTTTIRMLLDIVHPDAGEVALFGARATSQTRDRVGYLPEERGLYNNLGVIPNLLYLAALRGVPQDAALRRANELLTRLALVEHRDKRVRELSRGLGQLAQFAATLVHDPALVVLDEPFNGLDPINARLMKTVVAELRDAGVAILFSTHQMADVEELCDRVLLLDAGQLVLEGSLAALQQRFGAHEIFVVSDRAAETLPGVTAARQHGRGHVLSLARDHPPEAVLQSLLSRGARIERFAPATPSLEEIFLRVVQDRHA